MATKNKSTAAKKSKPAKKSAPKKAAAKKATKPAAKKATKPAAKKATKPAAKKATKPAAKKATKPAAKKATKPAAKKATKPAAKKATKPVAAKPLAAKPAAIVAKSTPEKAPPPRPAKASEPVASEAPAAPPAPKPPAAPAVKAAGAPVAPAPALAVRAPAGSAPAHASSPLAQPPRPAPIPGTTSVGEIAAPKRPQGKPVLEADAPESKRVALAVADAALDKKAVNVEIIDVTGKVDYADYVVVMSGRSDRQVQALARGIAEDVEHKTKTKCIGVEGIAQGSWVLMDFGDVIVHIFHDDVRGYYDLESLWMDAGRVPVPPSGPSD